MGKLDTVIKSEISRLARREIRVAVSPLVRQVRSLSKQLRALTQNVQQVSRLGRKMEKVRAEQTADLSVPPDELVKARLSPGLIKKLRRKLGITQSQLAALVGVSPAAVQSWEQGIAHPGGENKAAIIALRKLGRREVLELLEKKGVPKAGRKPRTDFLAPPAAKTQPAKKAKPGPKPKKAGKKKAKRGKRAKATE